MVSSRIQGNSIDLKKHNRESMHFGKAILRLQIRPHWITLNLVLYLYGKSMRVIRRILRASIRTQGQLYLLPENCAVICIGLPQVHYLELPLLCQRRHSILLYSSMRKCITWQRLCRCLKGNRPKPLQNTKKSNEHSLTQQEHTVSP